MSTFESLINKKLKAKNPVSLEELLKGQMKIGINIPSDYCYLLLNSNGYSYEKGLEITIDGKQPIVEVDDFVNLEWLIKERGYDLEDEDAEVYRDKFLRIAGCLNQDRILIGYHKDVENEIYLLEFDDDRITKISNSIFDFINNHLLE